MRAPKEIGRRATVLLSTIGFLVVFLWWSQPDVARAHTEAEFVAIPAGVSATITLQPTHGCGVSPTVMVTTRAPVEGATGGEVAGWTVSATADGEGNTILTWSGGVLPPDQVGAFPITFVAPDTVGELLLFPAIQTCENGGELAWISGDPTSDYPAPRILVLPGDAQPAATIDEVPADAPGRDQLVEVVDVDHPTATTTTTTTSTLPSATATTTIPPPSASPDTTMPAEAVASAQDSGDVGPLLWVLAALGASGVVAGGVAFRRRNAR